jgi:histone H3/H4
MPYASLSAVSRHIEETYWRKANPRHLSSVARRLGIPIKNISDADLIRIVQAANLGRQPLSDELRRRVLAELEARTNRTGHIYDQENLTAVARRLSHPAYPISDSQIRAINREAIERIKAAGKKPTRLSGKIDKSRADIPQRLQEVIEKKADFTFDDAARTLGLTGPVLWRILKNMKTTFKRIRVKAKTKVINEEAVRAGGNITNEELALRLRRIGITESDVKKYRERRGKQAGSQLKDAKERRLALAWISFFTAETRNTVLPLSLLRILTGIKREEAGGRRLLVIGAVNRLIEEELITEVWPVKPPGFTHIEGDKYYSVTPAGRMLINLTGRDPRQREATVQEITLEDLEEMRRRLVNARNHVFGYPQALARLSEIINNKKGGQSPRE